ncbi:MAG: hypothetical protein K6A89_12080 [Treponema sp.]|nr:hypothetical protein [Treponema sp.]
MGRGSSVPEKITFKELDKRGVISLLVAIKRQAEKDIQKYEKNIKRPNRGDYVSKNTYKDAKFFLKEIYPGWVETFSSAFIKKEVLLSDVYWAVSETWGINNNGKQY